MAFTFQINDEVKFKHDEVLLDKANQYKPVIHKTTVFPQSIVQLVHDPRRLEGWGVENTKSVSDLPDIKLKRDQKIVLDFGNHQVGKFSMDVNSVGSPMDAPLFIKLKFAEMPAELKHKSEDYSGWLSKSWIQEEYIHLDVLPTHLELQRRYSFRYVEITVIDTSPKWQAVFSNPQIETESSATEEKLSAPMIKDQELNSIYQVGLKTLQDCMQDVFEDGPKRDRRLWIGDLRLQALSNYATFKDVGLIKRCLYLFGAMTAEDGRIPANVFTQPQDKPDDTFLFDYSLFFISILDDFQKFQSDQELLNDLYPIAKKQMDVALRKVEPNGELVLDDDYPVFIDWSNDFDKSTAGQAVLIYTLRQFIHLAEMVNDDVGKYFQKLTELVSFSQSDLFDDAKGLFVSGPQREANIASQVWMVLAHVMDDSQNKQIMMRMADELFPITGIATPYMYHHVTQALFEAGMKEKAIKLMKDYWGQMISLGADTYWEAFEPAKPDYSPYGSPILNSYCHAWSCTPVYLIRKYLIGEE